MTAGALFHYASHVNVGFILTGCDHQLHAAATDRRCRVTDQGMGNQRIASARRHAGT